MNLKTEYNTKIRQELQKELNIKNINAVPKVNKVIINVGVGSILLRTGEKKPDSIVNNISLITGQKPVVKQAKISVSNFKLRKGMPNGVTVTLRGQKMYDFLEKLTKIIFPRVRDFQGISKKSFDKSGNFNIGMKEHIVFPEIDPDEALKTHGMQITVNTSTNNPEHNYQLLLKMGFPFKEAKQN